MSNEHDVTDIEQIHLPEPSDWISRHAKMRAEAMRRRAEYDAAQDLARASLRYGAGLTERDVQPVVRESARRVRVANVLGAAFVLSVVAGWVAVWAGWL